MTAFGTIRLIAGRELRERVRARSFLISTAFSLALILAAAIIPSLLSDDGPEKYDVGVVGTSSGVIVDRLESLVAASGDDVRIVRRAVADSGGAGDLVKSGDLDVAVIDGAELLVDDELNGDLGSLLQLAHREAASEAVLAEAGVTGDAAARALRPTPLAIRALDPPDEEEEARETIMFVGTILLYGQLLTFGYAVASGILEEKASRVVEVVLAKARSRHVLAGKIIGIGLLGFLQLVVYVTIGLVAAAAVGEVDLPPSIVRNAVEVLAWFVLGFAFYSCAFAVGGALASRTEELQSTTGPISLLAVMSFFAAMFTGGDPDGLAARLATFFPPSAPLVLPIRSAAGELALWEAVTSVALVLLTTYALVRIAGRVYAGGALHTRNQLKLRAALSRTR